MLVKELKGTTVKLLRLHNIHVSHQTIFTKFMGLSYIEGFRSSEKKTQIE